MSTPNDRGPYLARYLSGEREAVWAELRALGPGVREGGVFDDAWAVACETMQRARRNVTLIIRRLDRLSYSFWDGVQGSAGPRGIRMAVPGGVATFDSVEAMAKHALSVDRSSLYSAGTRRHIEDLKGLIGSLLPAAVAAQAKLSAAREARQVEARAITNHLKDKSVFAPADADDRAWLRELEDKGMVLPLSLRAWFETVGDVSLAGAHPKLCFWRDASFPGVYADPLMVSLDHFRFLIEAWLEEVDEGVEPEPIDPVISLSPAIKAGLAITQDTLDDGYTLVLPDAGADAVLTFNGREVPFVDFLRNAFAWGGFPGWADHQPRPGRELATLRDSLSSL